MCMCVWGAHLYVTSTCAWQSDIIEQVLFFWKILEVHLQGVCSALLSPLRYTLFVFQIRGL